MKAPKNKEPIIPDELSTDARWPHLRQVSPEPWHQRRKKQHDPESWHKVAELTGLCFCETYIPMVQQPGPVEILAEAMRTLGEQPAPWQMVGTHISKSRADDQKGVWERKLFWYSLDSQIQPGDDEASLWLGFFLCYKPPPVPFK